MPGKNIIGECFVYQRRIEILRSWFEKASGCSQEALMYHELGHCVLNRDHLDTYNGPYGLSTSIMHSLLINGGVWCEHRDYYVKELFQP